MKVGGSQVQSHSQENREFEVSPGYMKPCQRRRRSRKRREKVIGRKEEGVEEVEQGNIEAFLFYIMGLMGVYCKG